MYQHVGTYQGEEEQTVRKCDGDLSDLGVRESIPSEAISEMVKRVESRWGEGGASQAEEQSLRKTMSREGRNLRK